jgi:hypothetical protein
MKHKPHVKQPICAKCNCAYPKPMLPVENGYLCEDCLDPNHEKGDGTTRALRWKSSARRSRADAQRYRSAGNAKTAQALEQYAKEYAAKASDLRGRMTRAEVALGEAVPGGNPWLRDTLSTPGLAAMDASAHRAHLVMALGTECAALAIDAADSIAAENSLEKMLAHQLAAAHKTTLEVIRKAFFEQDPNDKARMMLVAARFMDTFQRGLLTIHRVRGGGDQRIVVEHVTVRDGGQAVIGNVRTHRETGR